MGTAKARRTGRGRKARPMSHAHARFLAFKTCHGWVTVAELRTLQHHLQGCPACRKAADEIADFERMLRRVFRRPRAPSGRCKPPSPLTPAGVRSNNLATGRAMYAVVDLETTGLWPRGDRIVEIAVVRLDPGLAVTHVWTTLLNPERDVGPVRLHGITAGDVADAPAFRQIAGPLAAQLSGAVLVAHNLLFDAGFLRAEFFRTGHEFPEPRGLCTLALAHRLGLPGGRTLSNCCSQLGLTVRPDHSALADAQAATDLLRYFLADGRVTLPPHEPLAFGTLPATSAPRLRPRGSAPPRAPESPLQILLSRLPARVASVDASEDAVASYADLLDRALEDRRVTADELRALEETTDAWGLTREDVADIHRSYLTSLVGIALADDLLSDAERRDLDRVAGLLGLESALPALLAAGAAPAMKAARPASRAHELAGRSVCFTGESVCSVGGVPLDREDQEVLAAEAGLVVAPRVTKKLDLLVLADPESMSGKAATARRYGVRMMAERAFWTALGVAID